MEKEIRADLRIARQQSGLSNCDVAHLLACGKERVSKLESGKARLNIEEVISLCVIYGRSVEHMFAALAHAVCEGIKDSLASIPCEPSNWDGKHEQRLETLNNLAYRLSDTQPNTYGA